MLKILDGFKRRLINLLINMKDYQLRLKIFIFLWAIFDPVPRIALRIRNLKMLRLAFWVQKWLKIGSQVNINGLKFRCVDFESFIILSDNFEKWMWNYIKLSRGDVFIDVGAHIGKYTIPAAKIVGKRGLVVAIESNPENYQTLLENIKMNNLSNVIAVNIAAWNQKQKLKLYIGDTQGHHSIKENFGLGYIFIDAAPLDEILEDLKVKKVNFIKIDVEGAEREVLEGLITTIKMNRPVMVLEIKRDFDLIKNFMSQFGYEIKHIVAEYYVFTPYKDKNKF